MIITYLDIFMLFITGVLAWVGIFSSAVHDNFLQRVGLGIIGMFSWGRAYVVIQYGIGNELYVWSHAGVFLFAVGTWWKFSLRAWVINPDLAHGWFPYGRRKEDIDVPI